MSRRRPAEFVDWISRGNLEDRLVHPSSHPAHWQCRSFIPCSPKCARSPRLLNPRSTGSSFFAWPTIFHLLFSFSGPGSCSTDSSVRQNFYFFFSSINILYREVLGHLLYLLSGYDDLLIESIDWSFFFDGIFIRTCVSVLFLFPSNFFLSSNRALFVWQNIYY